MLILASASPRRKELLSLITTNFQVMVAEISEGVGADLSPIQVVQELAYSKAKAVGKNQPESVVIGADTIVSLENKLLGKPKNDEDAYEMLSALSGQIHQVYTGVSIQQNNKVDTFYGYAHVHFATLEEWEILEYIESREPVDKAGGYGIQGKGARFIESVQGDYFSVVGLPVHQVYQKLKAFHLG